jgi:hypothetical protein
MNTPAGFKRKILPVAARFAGWNIPALKAEFL